MATEICRDPFSRASLVRFNAPKNKPHTCGWCGQNARFIYAWVSDSIRAMQSPNPLTNKTFCGVECFRAYSDQ